MMLLVMSARGNFTDKNKTKKQNCFFEPLLLRGNDSIEILYSRNLEELQKLDGMLA